MNKISLRTQDFTRHKDEDKLSCPEQELSPRPQGPSGQIPPEIVVTLIGAVYVTVTSDVSGR
jgi:hypothetical protein